MKTHDLKIWPEWFELTIHRAKEFELRKDDRDFQPEDIVRLTEFDPVTKSFTGRVAVCRITCVLRDIPGLMPGYVALGQFFLNMENTKKQEVDDER